jgi:hypothetical protein
MAEAEFIERRIQSNGNTTDVNIDRNQSYIDTTVNGKKARVYGTQEQLDQYQNKKPDGTPVKPSPAEVAMARGFAQKFFGYAAATDKIKEGKPEPKTADPSTSGQAGKNLTNIVPNPLENYASFTQLFTLAVLTPQQFNNPTTYRDAEGLSFGGQSFNTGSSSAKAQSGIIFSSAGRADQYRTTTAFGTPEYYVDNFVMTSVVAANPRTGNQNAINFTFEIFEPYSMGLLLQTLQVAAIKAGYVNYLDSPFLLKLDFVGYNENGTVRKTVKPKFFVLKLKKVTFNVDESGSKYSVEAYPYNHQGYSDTVNTLFTDINIAATSQQDAADGDNPEEAGTVRDVLATGNKSLIKLLNDNEKKNVAEKRYKIPDVYEIQFPEEPHIFISNASQQEDSKGATFNPGYPPGRGPIGGASADATTTNKNIGNNAIARSDFGFGVGTGGNFPFLNDKEALDEETGRLKRGVMEIDPKKRQFQFMQKQSLTEIINQIILSSTYAKQATQKSTTVDGFIEWFKIDVQVEFLDYDDLIGDFAKKYIYRVVPFKVHSSVFGNPNAVPPGYSELEKKIVKRYDYIYTGQNVDVLNFEIKLDYLFYSGSNPALEAKTKDEQKPDNKSTTEETAKETTQGEGADKKAQTANLGKSKVKRDPKMLEMINSGSGSVNVEQKIAQSFHEAFINVSSADLVKVELEILGDTFWLVDSGLSNYFAKPSAQSDQVTEDGTMNYEGSDIYIYLSFRTPADINTKKGLVEFSYEDVESPFSGIYRVFRCESKFDQGKFTQILHCVRMQGQPQDFEGKPLTVDPKNSTQVNVGAQTDPKTNTADGVYDEFGDI